MVYISSYHIHKNLSNYYTMKPVEFQFFSVEISQKITNKKLIFPYEKMYTFLSSWLSRIAGLRNEEKWTS